MKERRPIFVGRVFFLKFGSFVCQQKSFFSLITCYENGPSRDLRVKVALVNVSSAVTIADLLLKLALFVSLNFDLY
jgi:hypothetical protein